MALYYCTVRYAFDAGKSITRASERGLGPEIEAFWALWNGNEPLGECHLGPKKVEHNVQGCINHKSKGSFKYMSFRGLVK